MKAGKARPRTAAPVVRSRSTMRIDPVAFPTLSCHPVSRPSVVTATIWRTPWRRIASAPGRTKSAVAAAGGSFTVDGDVLGLSERMVYWRHLQS